METSNDLHLSGQIFSWCKSESPNSMELCQFKPSVGLTPTVYKTIHESMDNTDDTYVYKIRRSSRITILQLYSSISYQYMIDYWLVYVLHYMYKVLYFIYNRVYKECTLSIWKAHHASSPNAELPLASIGILCMECLQN